MSLEKWIRDEVMSAHGEGWDEHQMDCPPGLGTGDVPFAKCSECPYALFKERNTQHSGCAEFPFGSEEHKTAACFIAAMHGVEL